MSNIIDRARVTAQGRRAVKPPLAIRALGKKTPGAWWESYGEEYPELQKFSIRILSLTCSSSRYECNWSAFEMVRIKNVEFEL